MTTPTLRREGIEMELDALKAKLFLAEQEIECLRSVVSEFEADPTQFVQWVRAQILQAARETLK